MSTVNSVDYAVIALYALLMVLVGIYVVRFNRGAAEYFRGGSRVPWLVAGLSCFMSGFSAWTFTGAAGRCLPRGNRGHRTIYWQCAELPVGVFRIRQTLAAEPDYHR